MVVWDRAAEVEAAAGRRRDGIQNQKQEPHTKVWGTDIATAHYLQYTTQNYTRPLHLHYTTLITVHYTTLHYTTLITSHYTTTTATATTTLHYITQHCATLITLHYTKI